MPTPHRERSTRHGCQGSRRRVRTRAGARTHVAFLVKPNLRELVELRGTALEDLPARLAACQDLVQTGKAAIVALTLAEQGAIAVTAGGAWRVTAPKIEPVSTVGAGAIRSLLA